MKNFCTYCGAILDDDAKICTNCGRVVPKRNSSVKSFYRDAGQGNFSKSKREGRQMRSVEMPGSGSQVKKSSAQVEISPVERARVESLRYEEVSSSGKENLSHIKPVLIKLAKIIFVLLVAVFIFAVVRVLIVSHGTYKFNTEMKMESENYSQAFSNYFDEGHWKFNFRENQVYYVGTDDNGNKYEITFVMKNGNSTVDELEKNGEKLKGKNVTAELMGMFMAESKT